MKRITSRTDDERVNRCANDLYQALQKEGIEVLFDGRTVGAGVKFSDADLLGLPFRMIVSPRNLEQGEVEILSRDKKVQRKVSLETAVETMKQLIADAIKG